MQIKLTDVAKAYHDGERSLTIIERLSIELPASGSVAIVGQSGVGKSTLLNLLGALDVPSSGSVLHDGQDVGELCAAERARFRGSTIGFILQSHALLPEFNARDNVAMPCWLAGESESESQTKSEQLLRRLGLAERLTSRPGQLSGGEQQRVAIARALVMNQRLVLADEPTGSLDVRTASAVQEELFAACRERKALLVLVTHSLSLASRCDYIFEMLSGGALERRPSEDLA